MEEEDKPVNEEPRPHGFWKSWYIQIKMWLGGAFSFLPYTYLAI